MPIFLQMRGKKNWVVLPHSSQLLGSSNSILLEACTVLVHTLCLIRYSILCPNVLFSKRFSRGIIPSGKPFLGSSCTWGLLSSQRVLFPCGNCLFNCLSSQLHCKDRNPVKYNWDLYPWDLSRTCTVWWIKKQEKKKSGLFKFLWSHWETYQSV